MDSGVIWMLRKWWLRLEKEEIYSWRSWARAPSERPRRPSFDQGGRGRLEAGLDRCGGLLESATAVDLRILRGKDRQSRLESFLQNGMVGWDVPRPQTDTVCMGGMGGMEELYISEQGRQNLFARCGRWSRTLQTGNSCFPSQASLRNCLHLRPGGS